MHGPTNKFIVLLAFYVTEIPCYPKLHFLSIQVDRNVMTGDSAVQPAFNYSLVDASSRHRLLFQNYTYPAVLGNLARNPCEQEGIENVVKNLVALYSSGIFDSDALTVILVPCKWLHNC